MYIDAYIYEFFIHISHIYCTEKVRVGRVSRRAHTKLQQLRVAAPRAEASGGRLLASTEAAAASADEQLAALNEVLQASVHAGNCAAKKAWRQDPLCQPRKQLAGHSMPPHVCKRCHQLRPTASRLCCCPRRQSRDALL